MRVLWVVVLINAHCMHSSLMPRPHPSAREKDLVKNDTILGPLRHFGNVTTMLIANQLANRPAVSGLHMTTCWIWLTKYLHLQKKYRTKGASFILANNWQKYTHSHVFLQVYSQFVPVSTGPERVCLQEAMLCITIDYIFPMCGMYNLWQD